MSGERDDDARPVPSAPADPPPAPSSRATPDTAADSGAPAEIAGERGIASVNRPLAWTSRISNLLAVGLFAALGLGLLGWYYARLLSTPRAAPEPPSAANADAPLPPLGKIPAPETRAAETSAGSHLLGGPPEEPPPDDVPDAWLAPATDAPPIASAPPVKTPEELARERRLSGPALARLDGAPGEGSPPDMTLAGDAPAAARSGSSPLAVALTPTALAGAAARGVPERRLWLPKGAFLDCTLETAIDSTLPGLTTCVTATDTFGLDGSTVLLARGTKLIGETAGQVRAGQARVFVLWSEARTPDGVVIPLASPGTDALGRSGIPGEVDRHFGERFGAAILISVIDGAVQAAAQSSRGGGDTVVVNPTASSEVVTEVLKSTLDIPPTVRVPHGERIQVLVARDLDFRTAYELRPTRR